MTQALNNNQVDENELFKTVLGHVSFQLLWAACELELFEVLHSCGPLTLTEISEKTGLQSYPLRVLLSGLNGLNLISRDGDHYFNSETVKMYLLKECPKSLVKLLGWQHHIVYKGLFDFTESLKKGTNVGLKNFPGNGNTLYERLTSHPETEKIFQEAMSGLSKIANPALAKSGAFDGVKHVVDVGGGDGTNAICLTERHKNLKVTVFDSKSVLELAKQKIAGKNLESQIDTQEGNLFNDPLPKGIDAVLFCHMFTIYSEKENIGIIKKTYDSLASGGRIIIFNMMGNDTEDGPVSCVLGSPYFLAIATGKGLLYPKKDYLRWMEVAGFRIEAFHTDLPLNHGILVGRK